MGKSIFRKLTKRLFILANILLSLLLILSCYQYYFDQEKFWFLGFLTLGSFFLLLAVVGFIVFWFVTKKPLMLISAITLAVCFSPLKQLLSINFNATFDIIKEQEALRVMTWNVEHFKILQHKDHPEIKTEMLQLIQDFKPDVACFQEMVGSNAFPDAINYLPAMAKTMEMPYLHYAYNPKLDFDGKHHFGIMIFSKYPILEKQMVSTAPYDYNNIFQHVDILRNEDTIRVFNVHLQSLKFNKDNLDYLEEPLEKEGKNLRGSLSLLEKFKMGFIKRKRQADLISAAMSRSPYPTILCGDFNDVPNSYAYHKIGNNMQNAFVEKGTGLDRTFLGISPTLRIDNIFYDKHFETLQYKRAKRKLSDHFPVLVDLLLKK